MTKDSSKIFLSLAAPALVIIGILAFLIRDYSDRAKSFPAFFTGIALISSSAFGRYNRRKNLLKKILNCKNRT